jgi:nucleoid-associated protein YgaU
MLRLVAYTVVSGDSLWAIAQAFLGSGNRWPGIYQMNKDLIGSNPNLIYLGQRYVFWI